MKYRLWTCEAKVKNTDEIVFLFWVRMAGENFWHQCLDLPSSVMRTKTAPEENIPPVYEKCSDIYQIEIEEIPHSKKILCIVK
jgi:hypothetical protein